MKVTISLNGIKQIKDIPLTWDEVPFGTLLTLESCGQDIIKVIALFTGVDYNLLLKSKINDLDQVIAVLAFLKTPAVPVIPKTILGYPVPEKLEFEQVQMYLDLKNYVSEAQGMTPQQQLAQYTIYCAVYACAAKNGKYSWEKSEEMKDEFLTAPCTEVMGIGNFTLMRLIGLKNNIDITSRKASSLRKRLALVLAGWRIRMALFLRSYIWRKKLV